MSGRWGLNQVHGPKKGRNTRSIRRENLHTTNRLTSTRWGQSGRGQQSLQGRTVRHVRRETPRQELTRNPKISTQENELFTTDWVTFITFSYTSVIFSVCVSELETPQRQTLFIPQHTLLLFYLLTHHPHWLMGNTGSGMPPWLRLSLIGSIVWWRLNKCVMFGTNRPPYLVFELRGDSRVYFLKSCRDHVLISFMRSWQCT